MTNGEKIRRMTDEELAEFLSENGAELIGACGVLCHCETWGIDPDVPGSVECHWVSLSCKEEWEWWLSIDDSAEGRDAKGG